jgi:hypothetical protein
LVSAHRAERPELAHEPLDLTARDLMAFTLELPPDLADPVDAEIGVEHPLDLDLELLVLPPASTPVPPSSPGRFSRP